MVVTTTTMISKHYFIVIIWACFVCGVVQSTQSPSPVPLFLPTFSPLTRKPSAVPSTNSPTKLPSSTPLWNFCYRMGQLPNASVFNPINRYYLFSFFLLVLACVFLSQHSHSQTLSCAHCLCSKNALNGMVVNIGVNLDAPREFIQFGKNYWNQSVVIGGYMYYIHQELARRGGFTVNYVVVGNISSFTNTVDFVYHQLSTYQIDIYGGAPVAQSANGVKSAYGLGYTRQLMDVSVVLISPAFVSSGYTINNIW